MRGASRLDASEFRSSVMKSNPPRVANGRAFFMYRALARAELGGNSVEEAFFRVDERGEDSVSHAEFWKVRQYSGLLYKQ